MSASKQFLLSFVICLAVFSLLGYYINGYFIKLFNDTGNNPSSDESQYTGTEVSGDVGSGNLPRYVSALVVGKDLTEDVPDSLMIIKADRISKKIMIAAIPADAKYEVTGVTSSGKSLSGSVSFKNTYRDYGIDYLINKLYALTDIKIDYYAVLDTNAAQTIFNLVCGADGLKYVVPEKMVYEDEIASINLYEGEQYLNGSKAVQLLRYKTYKTGTSDVKRRATQMDFVEELAKNKLTSDNSYKQTLLNESERKKLLSYVVTNASSDDVYNNLDLLFSLSEYEFISVPFRYNALIKTENVSTLHSDFNLPFKE